MLRVYEGWKVTLTKIGECALARNGKQMEDVLREKYGRIGDDWVCRPWPVRLTSAGKWDGSGDTVWTKGKEWKSLW